MAVLKSLSLVPLNRRIAGLATIRRSRLIARLEEQKRLVADPEYLRKRTIIKREDGEHRTVERIQRVKPWWSQDPTGNVVFSIYHGAKPLEIEKGKAGIAVPSREKLPDLIDALIQATHAGELDEIIASAPAVKGIAKVKKAA